MAMHRVLKKLQTIILKWNRIVIHFKNSDDWSYGMSHLVYAGNISLHTQLMNQFNPVETF